MATIKTSPTASIFSRNITILFLGLVAVQAMVTQINTERTRITASDLVYPIFTILTTLALLIAARQSQKQSMRLALAWYAFGASILFDAVGELLWSVFEIWRGVTPYPSAADFFYLLSYPLFLAGAFLLPRKRDSAQERIKKALDSRIILLSALLAFWTLVLGPQIIKVGSDLAFADLISSAYPVGDILMIWALVVMIYNQIELQDRRPVLLLAIGAIFFVIADTIFLLQAMDDQYLSGGLLDLVWVFGYFFCLQAAILQIKLMSAEGLANTLYNNFLSWALGKLEQWTPYYPYLFAITPFFIIFGAPNHSFLLSNFTLALWASGIILLVFIRQAISIQENATLNTKLNKALEQVHAKTKALEKTNLELQNEIIEHQLSKKQLAYKALHDSLTGLPNRAYLLERLGGILEFSRRYGGAQFAVLYLDCDHFKVVNDSLGHTIGDQLLIQIASRLESCVRASDMVGRIGGDEFVILLLERCDTAGISKIANRILKEFSKPFQIVNGKKVLVSTSIGIVEKLGEYNQPEDILRDADVAMYHAKSRGRNRYEFYKQGMRERLVSRLEIEHDLHAALERREFELHYQPILSLKDLRLVGFEALIRWRHPSRGLTPPMDFIPICEETSLIHKVGAWALQEACAQAVKWHSKNPAFQNLNIHVNISGNQVRHPHFVQRVARVVEQTGLNPRTLHLEITENVFIKNSKEVLQTFQKLKEIGVECELDDFGSGYSSLRYLHSFPIRNMKIDRSFIQTIRPGQNPDIVRAILSLAHHLDIRLTAEGIETEHQLEELRQFGCHFGQGFLFSKPLDPAAVEKYLESQPVGK
ncbi:MAG: EAL domain-containing protein [Anaerolineae bacterium]|nr:EAL domain-containing protein [Anaerolineae bacterium]